MSSPRRSRRLAGLQPEDNLCENPVKVDYVGHRQANPRLVGACEQLAVGLYICVSTMVLFNSIRTAVALIF